MLLRTRLREGLGEPQPRTRARTEDRRVSTSHRSPCRRRTTSQQQRQLRGDDSRGLLAGLYEARRQDVRNSSRTSITRPVRSRSIERGSAARATSASRSGASSASHLQSWRQCRVSSGGAIALSAHAAESGGESGIRTHGTLLTYTRFPSVRLKPLGHLSIQRQKAEGTSALFWRRGGYSNP